jgi:hypothetical protein
MDTRRYPQHSGKTNKQTLNEQKQNELLSRTDYGILLFHNVFNKLKFHCYTCLRETVSNLDFVLK